MEFLNKTAEVCELSSAVMLTPNYWRLVGFSIQHSQRQIKLIKGSRLVV